jgi:hypothetical protein
LNQYFDSFFRRKSSPIFASYIYISKRPTKESAQPGANPTTLIYNAGVVNFYNATGNLARFENALAYYNAGVVAVN